ncbi:MAG TPA: DHA2 family efflux MFS transporter permease subunit [Steroidobacteraceae bacterium]|nr:DHA2 family efflux MFS transporter permease subunit [Steroidobacteraceae bacterium]
MSHPAQGAAAMMQRHRGMITLTVMVASILQALDNTIANVALPRMQGSLSATYDQMTWVLTSYIVAAAIMTPLTGWLADRYGRKPLFLVSIVGFTAASALCGLAQSLDQIVLFRVLQGAFGAALIPMSQAVLFDAYPPRDHGRAMALWGLGVVLGPTVGPMLGGWLTDNYSWRWVFYINVPFGVLAVLGVLAYFPDTTHERKHFDFFGFAMLSVFVGALQVMLDRGPLRDWFNSTEIKIEAAVAALAFYLFITHTLTARRPFLRLAMFRDRNFLTGNVLIFLVGIVLFATLALLPPLLQNLLGYSVFQSGMVTSPRGLGTLIAMMVVGRIVGRLDVRLIIGTGLALTALSMWQMTRFSLQMDMSPIVWSGLIQGFGTGIVYVPMATLAFVTLPAGLRNEGTALFNLVRNIGSSIGISAVQALFTSNTQVMHASLAAHITPFVFATHALGLYAGRAAEAALNSMITAQAAMIAYLDDFHLMMLMTLLSIPLLLFVRDARASAGAARVVAE